MSIIANAIRGVLAATAVTLLSTSAWAIKLSEPQVLMRQGEKVAIDIPVALALNEQLIGANIAPERVFSVLGLSFPQSLREATVTVVERGGTHFLHIAGGIPKGNVVPVVMEVSTNNGRTVRQFAAQIPPALEPPPAAAPKPVKTVTAPTPDHNTKNEKLIAAEIILMEGAIARIEHEIATVSADLKKQNEDNERRMAALHAAVVSQLDATKSDATISGDILMTVIAGILGFSIAVAYYLGYRPAVPAGSRITLTGVGNYALEGECLRIVSESHDRPWAYRLADIMTGAPKRIEVKLDGEKPARRLASEEKVDLRDVVERTVVDASGSAELRLVSGEPS